MPPRALPRHLDGLVNRIAGHPGRQHAQGDPVAQTVPGHTASLRHNPRSCRQPAGTARRDTPGKPRSTYAKRHWARGRRLRAAEIMLPRLFGQINFGRSTESIVCCHEKGTTADCGFRRTGSEFALLAAADASRPFHDHYLSPRMVKGRSTERAAHWVASVMSVRSAMRSAPMARFLSAAMALGPERVPDLRRRVCAWG